MKKIIALAVLLCGFSAVFAFDFGFRGTMLMNMTLGTESYLYKGYRYNYSPKLSYGGGIGIWAETPRLSAFSLQFEAGFNFFDGYEAEFTVGNSSTKYTHSLKFTTFNFNPLVKLNFGNFALYTGPGFSFIMGDITEKSGTNAAEKIKPKDIGANSTYVSYIVGFDYASKISNNAFFVTDFRYIYDVSGLFDTSTALGKDMRDFYGAWRNIVRFNISLGVKFRTGGGTTSAPSSSRRR